MNQGIRPLTFTSGPIATHNPHKDNEDEKVEIKEDNTENIYPKLPTYSEVTGNRYIGVKPKDPVVVAQYRGINEDDSVSERVGNLFRGDTDDYGDINRRLRNIKREVEQITNLSPQKIVKGTPTAGDNCETEPDKHSKGNNLPLTAGYQPIVDPLEFEPSRKDYRTSTPVEGHQKNLQQQFAPDTSLEEIEGELDKILNRNLKKWNAKSPEDQYFEETEFNRASSGDDFLPDTHLKIPYGKSVKFQNTPVEQTRIAYNYPPSGGVSETVRNNDSMSLEDFPFKGVDRNHQYFMHNTPSRMSINQASIETPDAIRNLTASLNSLTLKLDSYGGDQSSMHVEEWIDEFRKFCDATGKNTENAKRQVLGMHLKDAAKVWYRSMRQSDSLEDILSSLKRRFSLTDQQKLSKNSTYIELRKRMVKLSPNMQLESWIRVEI